MSDAETKTENPFKVGAEVAVVTRNIYRKETSYRVATVERVYKNGNFIVSGCGKQQYKPVYDAFRGMWTVRETGSHAVRSGYVIIEPITDKLRAEAEVTKRRYRYRSTIDRIGKFKCPDDPSEELLSALQTLVAQLRKECLE